MTRLIIFCRLFYRLMIRPLFYEPVRTALTVFAVALGVAVVLAIDLAGGAATGSFHSSMETLAGDHDLEITASGGVPEGIVGTLAAWPYPIRISPRMEDYAVLLESQRTLPLIGLDLVAEGNDYAKGDFLNAPEPQMESHNPWKFIEQNDSVWVGSSLNRKPGDQIQLLVNDEPRTYTVRGIYPDSNGNEAAIVMDIAAAQHALTRFGRVDRILLKVPSAPDLAEWQQRLRDVLPPGVEVHPQGSGTNENRQMLAAFRWNLRLLSYISLVVGAFLIYNTISVSIVRRRPEIGIIRALGTPKTAVLAAFVSEAASFGLSGALIGLPLGRLMATGAVHLIAATVQELYVSSRPGPIEITAGSVFLALAIGVGIAVASAFSPAREASRVSPVEAMARGRREYEVGVHKRGDLWLAVALGSSAAAASRAPAIAGKPLFGYLAAILLIAASALAIPALVDGVLRVSSRWLGKRFGVVALVAARSLSSSLRRTSVLVGALSTAIAMMTAVGIMVGSFRQTVFLWMNNQLPADLYLRPPGGPAADRHPTISIELADRIANLPGVIAVDRLRAYEISYDGLPATVASVDLNTFRSHRHSDFLSGRSTAHVYADLLNSNSVIVSEPFAYKHHVKTDNLLALSLGGARPSFRIVDVYRDYSSERGNILMDRNTMLRYLPDPAPSNLAIYLEPGVRLGDMRARITQASAGHRVLMFSNRDLRAEAIRIFDRTFAITYALEAVAVTVAVMGIAGALLALVIDRRRELGLLRFLGASALQIRKLIVAEAALLGILANIAGVVLGYLLSLVLIFVINKQSFGWTIRFHWPVEVLLVALTVVYVATVLAGLYPAQVAVRLNPLEVVHEE
ncbi:MAG TPA: FtsX-like permease family protein [Candidatus Dormibacteraeota bacterium]|nr:FtsX-like permease family protein [Candidatus Dormibacteraeota bacterium]